MRTAIFPGTFDPVTNGHVDLIRRGLTLFDRIVVGVAKREEKGPLFTHDERVAMLRAVVAPLGNVEIREFSGLLVHFAAEIGAQVVIRGIRAVSDFEYEFQMALMNRRLDRELETVFLMPSEQYTYLNSTVVKEIARLGGSVSGLVPVSVEQELTQRFGAARASR